MVQEAVVSRPVGSNLQNSWGGDVGSKTTSIALIHWTSNLRLIPTINNFTGFKYFFEETVPVIAQKMAKSIAQRA
jgi:hypothetical protein